MVLGEIRFKVAENPGGVGGDTVQGGGESMCEVIL